MEDDSQVEFELEHILEKRITEKGKVEYLIKWKNVDDPTKNSWEPAANLQHFQVIIETFEQEGRQKIMCCYVKDYVI